MRNSSEGVSRVVGDPRPHGQQAQAPGQECLSRARERPAHVCWLLFPLSIDANAIPDLKPRSRQYPNLPQEKSVAFEQLAIDGDGKAPAGGSIVHADFDRIVAEWGSRIHGDIVLVHNDLS
jgi:hypothetical protein